MAVSKADRLIYDDVAFDVNFITSMVCLQSLNLLDGLGKTHGQVKQNVTLVGRGSGARQVANVGRTGTAPVYDDKEGKQKAAQRVKPPNFRVEANEWKQNTEYVENDIGLGVLSKCLDRRISDEPTPKPTGSFDDHGRRHDGNGRNGKLHHSVVVTCQSTESLDGDLEERSYHDDAEDQHANGLETTPANGIGVFVLWPSNDPRRDPYYGCGQKVKGLHQQAKLRRRARR